MPGPASSVQPRRPRSKAPKANCILNHLLTLDFLMPTTRSATLLAEHADRVLLGRPLFDDDDDDTSIRVSIYTDGPVVCDLAHEHTKSWYDALIRYVVSTVHASESTGDENRGSTRVSVPLRRKWRITGRSFEEIRVESLSRSPRSLWMTVSSFVSFMKAALSVWWK